MPPAARVVIALVNFNGYASTCDAIDSLLPSLDPRDALIVVDNASTDGSVERLAGRYPRVKLVSLPRNRGYPGACNAAIEVAEAQGAAFVLLANNDIVFAPDAVERMVAAAGTDARIGVVVPRIYYHARPTRIWSAGSVVSRTTGRTRQRGMDCQEAAFPPAPGLVDLEMCTGCCMLLRTSAARTVGAWREDFFLYYEETDWCWRLRRAGFRIVLDDRARIWHKVSESVGASSPLFWYYVTRNHILFVHFDFPALRRLVALAYVMGIEVPHEVLLLLARRTPAQARAVLRGCAGGLRAIVGRPKAHA